MRRKTKRRSGRAGGANRPKKLTVPRLALIGYLLRERDSQKIDLSKAKTRKPLKSTVVSLNRREKRYPITIGANQAFKRKTQPQQTFQETGLRKIIATINPQQKTVCTKRKERRQQLFKQGTAGWGKRKSPGRNHHYQHTNQSNVTCKHK